MWEKHLSTQETESVVQAGSTLRVCSEKFSKEAVVVLDYNSTRLQVSMRSGEYVYVSDWLELSPLCPAVATVQAIRTGLERWLLLVSQPYTKQQSDWPPLELTILLIKQIEAYLA